MSRPRRASLQGRLDTVINITAGTDLSDLEAFRQMVDEDASTAASCGWATSPRVEIGGQNYDPARDDHRPPALFTRPCTPTPDGNPLEIVKAVNRAGSRQLQRGAAGCSR